MDGNPLVGGASSGRRILVCEMIVDEDGAGSLTAAAFSMLVLLGTHGQFTAVELRDLLERTGFADVRFLVTYGGSSIVSRWRP